MDILTFGGLFLSRVACAVTHTRRTVAAPRHTLGSAGGGPGQRDGTLVTYFSSRILLPVAAYLYDLLFYITFKKCLYIIGQRFYIIIVLFEVVHRPFIKTRTFRKLVPDKIKYVSVVLVM